jgi:hypothetical protein
MTPEQIASSGTESGHQRAVFAHVAATLWQLKLQTERAHAWDGVDYRWAAPLRWLHAIPNGGARGDDSRSRAIRGSTMKAEGVKEGIPDMFLPCPRGRFAGLYIEMKKPGGRASEAQKEFAAYATAAGYSWVLCDHWEKAFDMLVWYLTL